MKSTGQKQEETLSNESSTKLERSDEDVKKIARRITMLMRELEAHSLDMVLYSKALAAGKFPVSYMVQEENAIESAITELSRIQKAWHELFKGEIENATTTKSK